jgi:deoxyribodipyrimidine photo-lyase
VNCSEPQLGGEDGRGCRFALGHVFMVGARIEQARPRISLSPVETSIVLFTRDLRLHDHPALRAAARQTNRVVPVFVLDDRLVSGRPGAPNRLAFLLKGLRDLDSSLRDRGSALLIRRGDVVAELMGVAGECGAEGVFMSEDVSGYARNRRRRLERACEGAGLSLRTFEGVTVVPPGELVPASGDHYRVFTPYWRAWRAAPKRAVLGAPRKLHTPSGLPHGRIPALSVLTRASPASDLPPGGESAGRGLFARWLRNGARRYIDQADYLPADATSHLSPYLHFGCLSANEVLARVDERKGLEDFARQLCWRDFHHQVMAARPDTPYNDYRKRARRWKNPRGLLEAWKEGRTGYPIVDAGMRQLAEEGFLPNRARLIVASFLTKTLDIDWRLGAIHFERLLVDGDLANNVGNWQWVAGTGNDTRPNRVLNPIRQAHRFDPEGAYVRRFVRELAHLKGRAVHEPWKLAPELRRKLDYPEPLVPPDLD